MPAPTVLRSSLTTIHALIKAELVAVTGIPAPNIRVMQRGQKKTPKFIAPTDLLMQYQNFTTDPGNRDRHDCRIKRTLRIIVRNRISESDEVDADDIGLTDPQGIIVLEELVLSALQNFDPQDGGTNILCFEPMYALRGDDYEREMPLSTGWFGVELFFAVPYELPLSQSFQ